MTGSVDQHATFSTSSTNATERGASLTVLDPAVTTKGDAGGITLTVLGMVAEMERKLIKERQREGIAKAKAKTGDEKVYRGGKIRYDRDAISRMRDEGMGVTQIAKSLGMSRMQVYRVVGAKFGES